MSTCGPAIQLKKLPITLKPHVGLSALYINGISIIWFPLWEFLQFLTYLTKRIMSSFIILDFALSSQTVLQLPIRTWMGYSLPFQNRQSSLSSTTFVTVTKISYSLTFFFNVQLNWCFLEHEKDKMSFYCKLKF